MKDFYCKCDQIRKETADLTTFTEQILKKKLQFLCSVYQVVWPFQFFPKPFFGILSARSILNWTGIVKFGFLFKHLIDVFLLFWWLANRNALHKKKFFIIQFFSKCDQIRSFPRIQSHLRQKFFMENFYAVLLK